MYEGAQIFLAKYFDSIQNQTDQNFDLLIVNDGMEETSLCDYKKDLVVLNIKAKLTIAQVRQMIIKYALDNKYSQLIFSSIFQLLFLNLQESSICFSKLYGLLFCKH